MLMNNTYFSHAPMNESITYNPNIIFKKIVIRLIEGHTIGEFDSVNILRKQRPVPLELLPRNTFNYIKFSCHCV